MQTQLLRNAFVHRLQVPVRCQPSASSAINAPPASRAQAAAAMLSSITVVALAA
jgi:hypothetical protein